MSFERPYWFRPCVRGCIADGHLVLLNIEKDLYYFISREDYLALAPLINCAFSVNENYNRLHRQCDENNVTLKELIRQGCLTDKPAEGFVLSAPEIEKPCSPFEHTGCDELPVFGWHHAVAVFFSGVLAHCLLKYASFSRIIKWLKWGRGKNGGITDEEKAIRIAKIYVRLRPLLLRNRICLYDSIAFSIFSKVYGVHPTIVFGVTGEPFSAHCWAQVGGLILNDAPQMTQKYTPIMAV